MHKVDRELKQDVETEIRWDPALSLVEIVVLVEDRVATLVGEVDTPLQRTAAEDAAKRVGGIRVVNQCITVRSLPGPVQTDAEVMSAVQEALDWGVSRRGS